MSLRYIFGGAGTGKSTFILNEIINSNNFDSGRIVYIVPEQFSLESEKQLVALSKNNCIMQPQIFSFKHLAYYMFSKSGKVLGKYLDETGKNMLLRKILFDTGNKLMFFNKAQDKQGFMENLSIAISEFFQYNISTDDLDKQINFLSESPENESTFMKLSDLRLIFGKFNEFISNRFISTDAILDVLALKIDDVNIFDGCEVWIDGFKGFTPQEFKVIGKLIKKAKRVNVSLLSRENKNSYTDISITDPFYEIKTTVNKLSSLAQVSNKKIEESVFLQENFRFEKFPQLRHIEKNFFAFRANYNGTAENIFITHSSNAYVELNNVAEHIIKLLREKNYRFSDIAILTGNLPDYEKGIRSVFKQFEIPVFIDSAKDILSHALTELIRAAIDIIVSDWSYESVFRFLKTGLSGLSRDDVDYLENYVLAYGVKGFKWKLDKWIYGFESGMFEETRVHDCRDRFMSALKPFYDGLEPSKKYSVRDITAKLFKMLAHLNVNATLQEWTDKMHHMHENEVVRQHTQIWGKICIIAEKMVEILGDEPVSLREYSKILEFGLKTVDMGIIPPSQDQVLVGDMERTRLPHVKALFLVGVNDGIMPIVRHEQGLFTDDERTLLNAAGMELAPDSRRKSFEDILFLYINACKPENSLYLSYTTGNISGKPMQPSTFITKIKNLLPSIVEADAAESSFVSIPRPMFSKISAILYKIKTGDEIPANEKIVFDWFSKNAKFASELETIKDLMFNKKTREFLSQKSISRLYGREMIASVSKLEKYVQCPYAYFLQYNLRAKERKIYEVQPVDIGSLFHAILEYFTKLLEKREISWRSLDMEIISNLVNKCIEELTPQLSSEVLLSTARYKYIIKRVGRIAKKSIWALSEHIKNGDFEIYATELEFKYESPIQSIVIDINGERKLILNGRIDRVDILDIENSKYIKIIDYKSGSKKFDIRDIYFGTQLQLMLYLDVFIENGADIFGDGSVSAEILPGGIFYFNIDDPLISYKPGENSEAFRKRMFEHFKMSGLVLSDEDVMKGLDRTSNPSKSSLADLEKFDELRKVVKEKVNQICSDILKGNINAFPFKKDKLAACDYCLYASICQINAVDNFNKFNNVKKISISETI